MSTYFEAAVGMIGTGASKLRKLELKFSWGGGGGDQYMSAPSTTRSVQLVFLVQ